MARSSSGAETSADSPARHMVGWVRKTQRRWYWRHCCSKVRTRWAYSARANHPVDLANLGWHRAAESQRVDSKCDLGRHPENVPASEVEVELPGWIPEHGS